MTTNKFTKGYWTHKAFMDVFIKVLSVQYIGPKYTKLKVMWWNKSQTGNPFFLGIRQVIKVRKEQYKNWKRFSPTSKEDILQMTREVWRN